MIRTQVYLEQSSSKRIRAIAAQTGKKQSEIIREAIDQYVSASQDLDSRDRLRSARGLWKHRNDLPELERLRSEGERR